MINIGAGIFDVIGPIMVGPSSSHTAGAACIGNIASRICGLELSKVDFYLHGSFAKTYEGHGTGKALLGGILGMSPSDEKIRESESLAREKGISFYYHLVDLGDVHPNTVKIIMHTKEDSPCEVTGSSVGGGNILITSINGMDMQFSARYPTIITKHLDQPGIVAKVTEILSNHNINIAFLKVFRQSRGSEASMVIETDQKLDPIFIKELENISGIKKIMFLDIEY
ncbi:MAG TPA: L-serine ammonia-lyase, iron-sulfur-dependent subunit beta [Syntrophomonadaceae bacterium]|nr:L-serine ammonia-lyase, iron-sulfur-dependent subunit beta [Syntrophomonadaceae bacterium]